MRIGPPSANLRPGRNSFAAAIRGGDVIAPVRRKAAASSAEESRCVASGEAIGVAPSAIGAAEGASERRIACAEAWTRDDR
jgi:hypothetical protein